MDLSKYDTLAQHAPDEIKQRYDALHVRLKELNAAPVPDMPAIDAVIVELDELQAAAKDAQRDRSDTRGSDTQRF